jgi:hypothetical protein
MMLCRDNICDIQRNLQFNNLGGKLNRLLFTYLFVRFILLISHVMQLLMLVLVTRRNL